MVSKVGIREGWELDKLTFSNLTEGEVLRGPCLVYSHILNTIEFVYISPLNVENLPEPQLPAGAMELTNREFLSKMETDPAYVSFTFPPDVEGYCFRLEHWARNAPREREDL